METSKKLKSHSSIDSLHSNTELPDRSESIIQLNLDRSESIIQLNLDRSESIIQLKLDRSESIIQL